LKKAFDNEPDYKVHVVADVKQLKYYLDMFGDEVGLVLYGCGSENKKETVIENAKEVEELKYFWPKMKMAAVSTEPELLQESVQVLRDKIECGLNLSIRGGLAGKQIVDRIELCLAEIIRKRTDKNRPKGIMILDDDTSILSVLGLLIQNAGNYKVMKAQSIQDFLNYITGKIEEIDVALIDYNLEGMTSERIIKALHQSEPRIKIVVVTGAGGGKVKLPDDIVKIAFKIINKPFNNDEIIEVIKSALQAQADEETDQNPKILVIDDSPETMSLLKEMLAEEFNIIDSRDGRSGVVRFKEIKPDLVILDYKLPDKTGLEVLKELKEIDPAVEVIIVTIEKDPQVTKKFMAGGALKVIYKPFDADELEKAVLEQFEEIR
jgi:CheY-like chemotaxis protein